MVTHVKNDVRHQQILHALDIGAVISTRTRPSIDHNTSHNAMIVIQPMLQCTLTIRVLEHLKSLCDCFTGLVRACFH